MPATIVWSIDWMQTTPTTATPPEYVLTVGWRVTGTQDGFVSSAYGTVSFQQPEQPAQPGSFTPYSQLTESQVLGWVWDNGVNKEAAEASIQQQINNQINPPVIQPPLPWVNA